MNDLQSETLTHRSLCERFVGRVAGTTLSSGRPCPAPPPRQKSPAASSLDRIASSSAIGDKEMKQTHTHFVSVCIAETLATETFVPLGWVRVAAPEASDVGLSWVTRLGNIVSSCSACALWNWCVIALMVPCLRCLRNLGYQAHYYGLFGSCRAPGKVVHC